MHPDRRLRDALKISGDKLNAKEKRMIITGGDGSAQQTASAHVDQRPCYPDYEPLTAEEAAELTRLARKAVGVGVGCGAMFTPPSGHGYEKCHVMWANSFIKFGGRLLSLATKRGAEMQSLIGLRGNNFRSEWGTWRSEAEIAAAAEVAQLLEMEAAELLAKEAAESNINN